MEKFLNQILGELQSINARLENLEANQRNFEGSLKGFEANQKNFEGSLKGFEGSLKGFEANQNELVANVKLLTVNQEALIAGQKEHTQLLLALEHKTDVISATLNRYVEDHDNLKGDVTRLTKRVDGHDTDILLLKKVVAQ